MDRAIALTNFHISDCSNLTDELKTRRLQEEILVSMEDHIRSRYHGIPIAHLGRLLLYLPRLRYVKFLVPRDIIFPEVARDPNFISSFIKDLLLLPPSFGRDPKIIAFKSLF